MVRTTTTTGNREVMPVIQMALVDERRCCNAPTRPWPPVCHTTTCPRPSWCVTTSSVMQCNLVCRSSTRAPAAELQWSCSAQAAELQWSARRRRRSSNGALDAGDGAAMQCNTCAAATRISLPTDDAMPHVCGAVTQISPAGVVIVVTRGCGGDHRRGLWQSGDDMWPARLN